MTDDAELSLDEEIHFNHCNMTQTGEYFGVVDFIGYLLIGKAILGIELSDGTKVIVNLWPGYLEQKAHYLKEDDVVRVVFGYNNEGEMCMVDIESQVVT
ncbi:hypothetical protein LJC55_01440 [Eubacteriales bacterium OttesenSCG-928-N14]|nr:hypothetical protein [Eubacteriales bacterium OttesenSCG-928-N14]